MITFQRDELRAEFEELAEYNARLQMIYFAMDGLVWHYYRKPLIITSIYRDGDKGVHGQWRGLDCDNDNLSPGQKQIIEKTMNSVFQYDPERPNMKVCFLHAVDYDDEEKIKYYTDLGINPGGDHFHIQTHRNTVLI